MERMTHERANGIKTGYWSPETKETLVQRLAAYENTGLEPWEIGPSIEKAAKDAETATATKMAECIAGGIKDTVDTISHTRKVIRAVRKVNPEFSVLSGFDEYYLVNRASGGNGVLCGLTNVEPELFVRLHGAYQAGDFATAIECAKRISSLMAVYDACDLFISAIKVAVNIKGLPISTAIFDPAIQASDDQKATIEQLLS